MLCQNCGKEMPEGANFCTECGAKVAEIETDEIHLNAVEQPREETAVPAPVETVAEETVAAAAAKMGKRKETLREKYFSFHGRLNRKPYILRGIGISVVLGIIQIIFSLLVAGIYIWAENLNYVEPFDEDNIPLSLYVIDFTLSASIYIIQFVADLSLAVRRMHDLNHSGVVVLIFSIISIVSIVPFLIGLDVWVIVYILLPIGLIFGVYLTFFKGTEGDNKYGPDPLAK